MVSLECRVPGVGAPLLTAVGPPARRAAAGVLMVALVEGARVEGLLVPADRMPPPVGRREAAPVAGTGAEVALADRVAPPARRLEVLRRAIRPVAVLRARRLRHNITRAPFDLTRQV